MNPYRIPEKQILPEPLDFAYQVFSTDARVMQRAREKFEVPEDDVDNVILRQAVLRLWHIAKEAPRLARHKKGWSSCPEQAWYDEARILGERVGKRWETTPIPTLVEALKDSEMLYPLGFPRVSLVPGQEMIVTAVTYVTFRGKRLVLGSELNSGRLVVHDFKIGKNSMFCNSTALHGGCFSDAAFPFRLRLDTMQVGQRATLNLENVSDELVEVSPTLFGVALDF